MFKTFPKIFLQRDDYLKMNIFEELTKYVDR